MPWEANVQLLRLLSDRLTTCSWHISMAVMLRYNVHPVYANRTLLDICNGGLNSLSFRGRQWNITISSNAFWDASFSRRCVLFQRRVQQTVWLCYTEETSSQKHRRKDCMWQALSLLPTLVFFAILLVCVWYPHMLIGKVWICHLLFVCVCVCVSAVTDFSTEDKAGGVTLLSGSSASVAGNHKCLWTLLSQKPKSNESASARATPTHM